MLGIYLGISKKEARILSRITRKLSLVDLLNRLLPSLTWPPFSGGSFFGNECSAHASFAVKVFFACASVAEN